MTEVDLQALSSGDEAAFRKLVRSLHPTLLRLALVYAPTREVAEDAVQETWVAVLRGLDGFESRAKLRTWVCRILVNIARRRSGAEVRAVPFSSLDDDDRPVVPPDRFLRSGPNAGHWASPPRDWSAEPEHMLLSRELQGVVSAEIATLPTIQRIVISMRDVEGWASEEVCELLDIDPGYQRVALHRARGRVRAALERYLNDVSSS